MIRLGQEEHALDVHIEEAVELRLRRLCEPRHFAMAGVVDEMVEAVAAPVRLQCRPDAFDEGGKARDLADVELDGDRLAAERCDLGHDSIGGAGFAAVGEDHVAAAAGDADGRVATKAAAGTGDDGNGGHS